MTNPKNAQARYKLAATAVSATILITFIWCLSGGQAVVNASPLATSQIAPSRIETSIIATATTLAVTPEAEADEAQSFAEYQAVEAALQPYIEAAKTGDGALSRSAFYDHAHIVGSVNGTFFASEADEFQASVSETGASPEVQHQIVWIDISGPAAAAKVEFINWGGFRFTDFFVLYKHNGQWKISGKVYDSHTQN